MATKFTQVLFPAGKRLKNNVLLNAWRNRRSDLTISRNSTFEKSGAIMPEPVGTRFGVVKVFLTVFPFLYLGQWIGKTVAAWLEETELFVPDDDDD